MASKANIPHYSSFIEISKSALRNNVEYTKKILGSEGSKISCVLKGNAYGHGIEQMIKAHLEIGKIDHFCVYSAFEAYQVSKYLEGKGTILVIGHVPKDALEWIIENHVEFFVFDSEQLPYIIEAAKNVNKKALIHLEAETGMNRTGLLLKNFNKVLDIIQDNLTCLTIKGLCTHFAGAESMSNHVRVKKQITKFKTFKNTLEKHGLSAEVYHSACSAAALRFKNTRMDLIRTGVLQFGFWPNKETFMHNVLKRKDSEGKLKRIMTWKTEVMTIKSVKKGEYIGYGDSFLAHENKLIAVLPVGYANGYSRSLSNQARVLIKGEFLPVIGTVNMNAISIDITGFDSVKVGDEVVLIGTQGDHEISVASFGDFTSQLNYEVLARLPNDIPRYLVD